MKQFFLWTNFKQLELEKVIKLHWINKYSNLRAISWLLEQFLEISRAITCFSFWSNCSYLSNVLELVQPPPLLLLFPDKSVVNQLISQELSGSLNLLIMCGYEWQLRLYKYNWIVFSINIKCLLLDLMEDSVLFLQILKDNRITMEK